MFCIVNVYFKCTNKKIKKNSIFTHVIEPFLSCHLLFTRFTWHRDNDNDDENSNNIKWFRMNIKLNACLAQLIYTFEDNFRNSVKVEICSVHWRNRKYMLKYFGFASIYRFSFLLVFFCPTANYFNSFIYDILV